LENAHPADLAGAEISASGLGVRFPKLDADLYIPALLSMIVAIYLSMAGLVSLFGTDLS